MGNGNIDVGNKTPARQSGQPIIRGSPGTGSAAERRIEQSSASKVARRGFCGAMSQQSGDSGTFSAPQKLVQLVGYRDPKPEPWVRPGPIKQ